jgi:hypothetical protein
MFFHVIPLEELKRHSVTYWRPGRDTRASTDTWIVLSEFESGYATTVIDLPAADCVGAEDVLELYLQRVGAESVDRARNSVSGSGTPSLSM